MFDFLNSKKKSHADALTNQTIGGQSVIYRLFRQTLSIQESQIQKLELTYFAASVMTFVYLHLSDNPEREEVLDEFSRNILKKSIASAQQSITLASATATYQRRYLEYSSLIQAIFDPVDKANPELTLLLHVFESVTDTSARGHMIQIASACTLINQYIADHIDFVRNKL